MKLTTFAILTTAAGLAAAAANPQTTTPASPVGPIYYNFRTSVKPNQPTAYNNHYLISWHTGAGLSDATFAQGKPAEGQVGWFNGTYLNWFEPSSVKGDGNYSVKYQVGGSTDSKWSPVCFSTQPIIAYSSAAGTNLVAFRLK
jgi:hypothetical protein